MNALATFSQYSQPPLRRIASSLTFLLIAIATAGAIGLLLGGIGTWLGLPQYFAWLAPAILVLGLADLGFVRLRLPSSLWQVPAEWIRCRITAPAIWGVFLGSGLSTQMPYPSFYALLLLAAFLPLPWGVAVLAAYGFFRALPALGAAIYRPWAATPAIETMLQLRLLGHVTSGFGCLVLAGALIRALLE